jgi:uncharacterized protein
MSLVFDTAAPQARPDPRRADVACFVGHVARRPGAALPTALRAQLRAAGWVDGIWARPPAQLDSLLNLPVVLDSWAQFEQLFAWDQRPVRAGGSAVCASYLGAAVRSFFARGGRRAVVVRVGDPWPLIESNAVRVGARNTRLGLMLPALAAGSPVFAPHDPSTWQGVEHLAGLREVSLLLLPDLPEACSSQGPEPAAALPLPAVPTGFVECSDNDAPAADTLLSRIPAPRLDGAGYLAWRTALQAARSLLARREQREVQLVAALPLPQPEVRGAGTVHAQADMARYLRDIQLVSATPLDSSTEPGTASAFIQLAWPWLGTAQSADLPQGLEPPDGALAGLLAAGASLQGSFRSVAGSFSQPRLRDVVHSEPRPAWGGSDASPDAQLARQVCVFAPQPGGWALQSDVTLSSHEAWRFGGASRLMATLLRAARAAGDGLAFELNGPATWLQVRRAMEHLLEGFWREGAFGGADAGQAFSVRCDRHTMRQADLDNGRLVVEISVRPAASVERITVVLDLNSASSSSLREAA